MRPYERKLHEQLLAGFPSILNCKLSVPQTTDLLANLNAFSKFQIKAY